MILIKGASLSGVKWKTDIRKRDTYTNLSHMNGIQSRNYLCPNTYRGYP